LDENADAKNKQNRWAQGENTMTFRKETIEQKDESTNQSKKEQVMVSRLKTGYTRATHRHFIKKTLSSECRFCGVSLTTEHILWECTETTREIRETGTTKEIWTDETERLKRLRK
jgi:queuine/archaeosine tRNA-ribosyltransferase